MSNYFNEDKHNDKQLQIGGNNSFTISSENNSYCKKFKCAQHTYKIRFNNIEKSFGDAQNEIQSLFTQLHNSTIYQKHLHRIDSIKKDFPDYKLIEIWECEFKKQIKESEDLKDFLKTECNISEPIDP